MASAARHSPVRRQPMGAGGRGRHAAARGGGSAGAPRGAGGTGSGGNAAVTPTPSPASSQGHPPLHPPSERTGSKPALGHAQIKPGTHPPKSPSSHHSLPDGNAGLPRARVTHSAPLPLFLHERMRKNPKSPVEVSDSPAAVPQHGGTHQAEEKSVEITSSGNKVTFRWICSKFSTRAMKAPTTKSTTLLCTRC